MDLGLSGRVYVVSGGSSGLGLATARALVAEGAAVVVGARGPERLAAAVADLGGRGAEGVRADLADPASAADLVAAAQTRFGRLDGALISVGGPPPGPPSGLDDEAWQVAFASVFLGPVRLARAVAAAARPEAAMLFVLSTSARSAISGLAASNGLRPGLAMHVKDLADELGPPPRSMRVNAVLPGRIATDRTRSLDAASADPERTKREREAAIPLRRYGEPAELGRVAAFLLSPAASYLTGTSVVVDGGALRVP